MYRQCLPFVFQVTLPGSKYPLKAPDPELLRNVHQMVSESEPPRYESQLRRSKAFDQTEGDDEVDNMVDEIEKNLAAEMERDEAAQAKKAAAKPKAKRKAKPSVPEPPRKKARTHEDASDNGDYEAEEGVSEGEDEQAYEGADAAPAATKKPKPPAKANPPTLPQPDQLVEYPKDAYEPPAHITGNHIYSNTYKKIMSRGKSKEEAQEEARYQCLVYRTHGVVSRAKVGTFRAPKDKSQPKKAAK